MLLVLFLVSLVWNGIRMYKNALVSKMVEMPMECRGDLAWYQSVWTSGKSLVSGLFSGKDKCEEYHKVGAIYNLN